MFWHHDGGVKLVAVSVVVEAMLEDGVAGLRWERVAIVLAECDEEASSCGLIVREIATVFVPSVERDGGRTLLSAAVDLAFAFHQDYSIPGLGCLSVTDEPGEVVEKQEQGLEPRTRARSRTRSKATDRSVRPTLIRPTIGADGAAVGEVFATAD